MSCRTLNYAVVDKIYKNELTKLSKDVGIYEVSKNIENIMEKLPIDYLKDWLSVVNQLEEIKWSDSEWILFFTRGEKVQKLIIAEIMINLFIDAVNKTHEEKPELFNKCEKECCSP